MPVLSPAARRHDIDALRVLAFGVLILYHVGMFYVADWGWHVKSSYLSEWLQYPMLLVNQWRMSLLFLVSGLAVHFLLRKLDGAAFSRDRLKRLLLPLLFGMAVIVPPQAYLQAVSNGAFAGNYLEFLWRYFTFAGWPEGAFSGSNPGITWNHLWYLPYLLFYSLLLAALLPVLKRPLAQRGIEWLHRLRGWKLYLLPLIPFLVYGFALRERFPRTHALLDDWYLHALYFTVFLIGYGFGAREEIWAELRRRRWLSLVVASSCYLLLMAGLNHVPTASQWWYGPSWRVLVYLNYWSWLLAVLGWAFHLLNRPWRWLPYATEAVYPWYILHQTITVVAGFYLAGLALGPVWEPVLVIAITIAGCFLLHEYLIRRSNLLRPLFGLKPLREDKRTTTAAQAA